MTNINEANISNIIEEDHALKSKLNKFKYDQVFFEETPKDVLHYAGFLSYGILKSLFEYGKDAIKGFYKGSYSTLIKIIS